MERARAEEMLQQLDRAWALNKDGHLERRYTFQDFADEQQ
jgi:pterin-4a-carbinolamine dehydratase